MKSHTIDQVSAERMCGSLLEIALLSLERSIYHKFHEELACSNITLADGESRARWLTAMRNGLDALSWANLQLAKTVHTFVEEQLPGFSCRALNGMEQALREERALKRAERAQQAA